MRMAGQRDVFGRGAELHGHAIFSNHFADARADQVHTEDFVCAFVGEDFGKAFGFVIDLRPTVGGEREFADFVGTSFGLQLLFGLADAGQFRPGVDDVGNQVVIDLAGLADDLFDTGHRFVFSLVREHRPGRYVADYPDAIDFGAVLAVSEHAALVGAQADVLQAQAFGVWAPADRDQYVVGVQ